MSVFSGFLYNITNYEKCIFTKYNLINFDIKNDGILTKNDLLLDVKK